MTTDDSVPWWASPTLRLAAVAAAPLVVIGVRAIFHIEIGRDDAADLTMALIGGTALVGIIVHRIQKGKNPDDSDPPINLKRIL